MKLDFDKLVMASGNAGKIREFADLLAPLGVEVVSQSAFDVPEAEENGLSFIENALIKARHAAEHTGLPAIADDSGLSVAALGGEPGIYSARYAGIPSNDANNNAKLLSALDLVPEDERAAHFHCAIALVRHAHDPVPIVVEGRWVGQILHRPQGEGGFGYDPLFYVEDHNCSSAELEKSVKNKISHRGLAVQKLFEALRNI